jgi:anti-anti-sigma factor
MTTEDFLTMTIRNHSDATAIAQDGPIELTELVRGHEQALMEQMGPLVSSQSIALDLTPVERIDAAGIAALVTLYANACQAGYSFTVSNAQPHVAKILALVGLDRILMSQDAVQNPLSGAQLQRSAA